MAISSARGFDFNADTFAYPNELVWEYHFDPATGKGWTQKRNPPPTYAHHCFPVVRSARQFLFQARFDPEAAVLSDAEYSERIEAVARRDPNAGPSSVNRIIIPGFANLRAFSQAHPALLKAGCGGAWQSYVQRGNWRMVFPFTRGNQERMAGQLTQGIAAGRLPIVHVATFPSLTINHALLLFGREETADAIGFEAYDPNTPERPLALRFDCRTQWFHYPRTHYFAGGRVNLYEVYRGGLF